MRVRLQHKSKPNNYTKSFAVNKADRWRERTCEYPGRSHGREKLIDKTRSKAYREKSANVSVWALQ